MTLILILFFILLYFLISKSKYSDPKRLYVIWITIALTYISGLRHEAVGNDTYAVMLKFESFGSVSWGEIWSNFLPKYFSPFNGFKDPGEDVFNKVLYYVIPNSRIYIIFVSILFLSVLGWFIYKHSNSLFSVLFTYSFYVTIFYQYLPNSSLRQTIALTVLLIAYSFLEKNKILYFLILIVLASTFHKSSIICILLLPLSYIGNVRKMYIGSLLLFLLVLLNYQWIGGVLGATNDVYGDYLSNSFYSQRSRPYMVILLIAGLYVLGLYFSKNDSKISDYRLHYYGTALTLCLVPLVWIDPSALRLISYFGVYMGLLVGNSAILRRDAKLYLRIAILIFLFKAITSNDNYHFMWEEMQLHERYGFVAPKKDIQEGALQIYYYT